MKKEESKSIASVKFPKLDYAIVRASKLQQLETRFAGLDREFKRLLISNEIRAKQFEALVHQNLAMKGRIPAPLCPICNEPKIAGGIQWIDHAECFAGKAKGKSQKAKI